MTWGDTLQPLTLARFRAYLVGRTLNFLSHSMASVAVAFAVLHIGGSATDLGVVLAARSIPQVVFLLYGGMVADRFSRHRVLLVAGVGAGVSQGVAAALLLGDVATVASLAAVEAVHGTVSAFTLPAMQGVVPLVVDRARLQQANALAAACRNGSLLLGPASAGVLVATAGAGWALALNAATYAGAGLAFARLALPRRATLAGASMLRELKEGWTEFTARTWVWVIVLGFGFLNVLHACAWITLGPVIADRTIGADGWGLVLSAQAVGMLVGTVLLLRLRVRHPLRLAMLGALTLAVPMAVLGAAPALGLLLVAAFVAGVGFDLFGITWDTALQQHIPEDRLSRVSSYDMLGSFVAIPVGQLLAGPLAGVFDERSVVLSCAALWASATIAVLLTPAVWRLRSEPSVLARHAAAPS